MNVLVVNAGSASLKLGLLDSANRPVAATTLSRWDGHDPAPVKDFLRTLPRVEAVGHRVVHGGSQFTGPIVIDERARQCIADLTDLAPLHQPRALAGIDAARAALPGASQVACFDTAFHAELPEAAATYALPAEWRRQWGLRRYGFHGLSHAYAARRGAHLLGRGAESLRVVSCHLGAGASLCAVEGGRSVDTTMGFTPLEGLVMATRSGSVDPGLLLWLLREGKLTVAELSDGLEEHSGLAGLSERSSDLRHVRAAAATGDPRASLALAVTVHRLRREIAAMAAAMDGLDVLVFTGGIGEHDADLRADAAAGLNFLRIAIDSSRNSRASADCDVSAHRSAVRVLVIEAREDSEIADQTRHVLS